MPFYERSTLEASEILAEREYIVEGSAPLQKVVVRIGTPKRRPSDGRYECIMEVDEGTAVSVKPMNGVDAFESLFLAIMVIGIELSSIHRSKHHRLIWMNGWSQNLRFPAPPDFSLSAVLTPEDGMTP
jgi:hypothetical protein